MPGIRRAPGRGTPERTKRAHLLVQYRKLKHAQAKHDAAPVKRFPAVHAHDMKGVPETYRASVVHNAAAGEPGEPKFYARLHGARSGLNDSTGHRTLEKAIRAAQRMHRDVSRERRKAK